MPWQRFMLSNIIGAFLWATLYGLVVYSLGREFERFSGRMVLLFAIALLFLIIGAAALVRRPKHWPGIA
jgi:membrane protein DedA with SNARE-associated domain